MAARGRAAAMAAAERRLPSVDEFAGQSWSAWVERAGPPAEPGLELEESSKGSKKLDAMTLIKEDMSIFGHCPAHDEFYLVVCNHCSQVVKPQAFQKHCERRHGPLSKLYSKCHAVNGQPAGKALRDKGARSRAQPLPEKAQKDNNLCLFMPVVNLEKIPSFPKPEGLKAAPKTPPKAPPAPPASSPAEPPGRPSPAPPPPPKEPPGAGGDSVPAPTASPVLKAGEKEPGVCRPPPRAHKKLTRKECDLNRQCGVLNPDTKKVCTRLLTCKIHSVHQRREVQGRAKDFDVLVAELKASSRREAPKEKSPPRKDPPGIEPPAPPALPQPPAAPPGASPCRPRPPHAHCPPPRARLSSDSDPEEGDGGLFPFPLPKEGGSRGSSEDSEEEGAADDAHRPDCHYAARPPRPQAFCTFGSRLVSPGCYVFNRRLDRFCSALGSMLERHLSSHMWRKIPPAADSQLPAAPAPPSPAGPAAPTPPPHARTPPTPTGPRDGRVPAGINYTVGSPHAAAACSQPECGGGGSQSITSPLPANIPSPSFSKLPSTKASKSSRAKEAAGGTEPDSVARKRKQPLGAAASPPYKRTCPGDGPKSKSPACQVSAPPGKTKSPAVAALNGSACAGSRLKRALPPDCRPPLSAAPEPRGSPLRGVGVPPPPPRCISEDEVKKRKNSATYCRPSKPKHAAPPPAPPPAPSPAPPDLGCSVRRKKPGSALGFEEKRSVLKSKAH
ncbi:ataxin-7-like protein 2 isoform X1 [Gallus gallus]|uniref:ataxin-7-like protein 2 isoform X1 n=1 Tax=Gallus gallus TaxID=9031 RepID=UPI001AEADFE0|nr:ataxin-7-like protein 2 isoform X1 [Gallus gallus]